MEVMLTRQLNGTFKPSYDSDKQQLSKIKVGKDVKCKITQPRNIKLHKKFFALIEMLYQNQETYINKDHLRKDLTVEAGEYDEYIDINGELKRVAKSISFANMSDDDFNELYGKFLDVSIIILGCEKQDITENIAQFY
jgi:hypothetical protein